MIDPERMFTEIERRYQMAVADGFLGNRHEYDISLEDVSDIENRTGFDFNNYWSAFRKMYRGWAEEYSER